MFIKLQSVCLNRIKAFLLEYFLKHLGRSTPLYVKHTIAYTLTHPICNLCINVGINFYCRDPKKHVVSMVTEQSK